MKVTLFHVVWVCFLVSVTCFPVEETSSAISNTSSKNDQEVLNRIPPQNGDFDDTERHPDRVAGKRHSFYRFWKTISKNVLPLLRFLEKATTSMLEKYCMIYRLSSRTPGGEGCLNIANSLSLTNGQDFPQSPSVYVLAWEGTNHFEKSMYTNVINSLRRYKTIFKEMLKYEKKRYLTSNDSGTKKLDCSRAPHNDEVMFFICQIDSIIISNIRRLIQDMKAQGRQYFALHLPELKTYKLPYMPPEPARRYFNLVAAYKFLEQVKETEWSLEYILMLEKDKTLRNRRSRSHLFYQHDFL